jgi:cystathionine beta-lyase/cystathionine gamma-synthase
LSGHDRSIIARKEGIVERESVSYILHHLGEEGLPGNAVSPPIFQTSIFCFAGFEDFREAITDEVNHSLYTRGNNPTVALVEEKLAALEKGGRAKLVSSGVSAIAHAVMAFVKSGDHVVCVEDCYTWTRTLLTEYLGRFGVTTTFVEGRDPGEIEAAIQPTTRVIYLESPTTFTFKLQDLPAVAAIARKRGIKTVVDNTWATPIFCNPLELGIDLVVHSASKYLGGNSDLIAGVIVGSREDLDLIQKKEFLQLGTVPDPLMAWLLLRGMRTLHVRMPVHYANALAVARMLETHPRVEGVLYPMLESYPDKALARRQMRGGSGLLSIRLATRDRAAVVRFTDRLRLFKRAVSWGGYESLVFPDAVRYAGSVPEDRVNLVRLHLGLEGQAELLEDLEAALAEI